MQGGSVVSVAQSVPPTNPPELAQSTELPPHSRLQVKLGLVQEEPSAAPAYPSRWLPAAATHARRCIRSVVTVTFAGGPLTDRKAPKSAASRAADSTATALTYMRPKSPMATTSNSMSGTTRANSTTD